MPVHYRFEGRLLKFEAKGKTGNDELMATIAEATSASNYNEDTIVLWDLRQSETLSDMSATQIRMVGEDIARMVRNYPNHAAAIVPNDLYYGLMRMLASYSEKEKDVAQFFRSEEEAMAWVASLLEEE
jgi:hypothetical protein